MHTLVGIIMGSASDWETMQHSAQILTDLGISHEVRVVSPEQRDYPSNDLAGE